jgi:hypothetical protein
MALANSHSQTPDVNERLGLLNAAAAGQLDALPCPRCKTVNVGVWFTHPAKDEYRTWFVCSNCGFEMRAQNTGRPTHYSAARDRTAKEQEKAPPVLATDQRS